MDLKEKIIVSICEFGESVALNCKTASEFYTKSSVTVHVPDNYHNRYEFSNRGQAMNWLMRKAEEDSRLSHIADRLAQKEEMKRFGDWDRNEEEGFRRCKSKEEQLSRLIHENHFHWDKSDLEDLSSQDLLNLFIALKKTDEKMLKQWKNG